MSRKHCWIHVASALATLIVGEVCLQAQGVDVSATVLVLPGVSTAGSKHNHAPSNGDVVVWLTPLVSETRTESQPAKDSQRSPQFRLIQKDKQFEPHLLVVPTGTNVEFPNRDPFFHNVFSLFNGKRFDLGMYESGTTRSVRFDREGVSYIFCNIHPEMGAVVLALSTPYYATSSADGTVSIRGVSPGSYRLHVWSETSEILDSVAGQRVVRIAGEPMSLGQIRLKSTAVPVKQHKNKFGEDYLPGHNPSY